MIFTLFKCQIRIVVSSEPEHKDIESTDQATSDIPSLCPSKVFSYLPSRAFQIFIVLSAAIKRLTLRQQDNKAQSIIKD